MANDVIGTLEEESTDLALHTKLCAQRYYQIINKFDVVDSRLDNIENILVDIREKLNSEKNDTYKTYLSWAGIIIVALGGALSHYILK